MSSIISFLRNLIYKYIIGESQENRFQEYEDRAEEIEARVHKIEKEAIFALENNELVVIVDHNFEEIPSWIEWDYERKTVSIVQQKGHIEEAEAKLTESFIAKLKDKNKLLLVSNDNDKKIVHFLPFILRK